ncbi:MAG: polysaccharide biosynthesis tyrosine autokinase [Clostridiales bacterium]|nr:polysaccharide biosynthesis tyrosine autokinase [Clostridiales bacterium]
MSDSQENMTDMNYMPLSEDEMEIDLKGLMYYLYDKKKMIIIVTLVCALLATAFSLVKMMAPEDADESVDEVVISEGYYNASANIYISEPNGEFVLNQFRHDNNWAIADFRGIVQTPELRDMVIENLALPYDNAVLNAMISVGTPSGRMMSIGVKAPSGDEAIEIANEYARLASDYIKTVQDVERTIAVYDASVSSRALTEDESKLLAEGAFPTSEEREEALAEAMEDAMKEVASGSKSFSKKTVVIGGALGFILIVAIFGCIFLFGSKVNAKDDLARLTGGKMLAVLPKGKENTAAQAEAMNTLCAKLTFMDSNIKRVVLTGTRDGEGTSFVAANMLRTLTDMGKRVVLVDADMEKSTLASNHGMKITKDAKGLAGYLSDDKLEAKDVVLSAGFGDASIVPCGKASKNTTAMLMTARFAQLMEDLAAQYDYVLVDTQPLGYVMDAAVAAKACDGVLVVAADGHSCASEIKAAVKRLPSTDCRVIGSVYTNVDMKTTYNRYYFPNEAAANSYR